MTCKILAASLLALTAIQGATISIEPPLSFAFVGQTVNLNIDVANVSDLFAFQFDIGFDPAVLSALSVTEGSFLPSGGTTTFVPGTIDNAGGSISFIADALNGAIPGVNGKGVLATIHFTDIAHGSSPISLENVTLLDSNFNIIEITTSDGAFSTVPEPGPAISLLIGLLALFVLRSTSKCLAR